MDKARLVVRAPTPQRVEGTTQFETLRYPWFPCRVTVSPAPDMDDPQGGRRRTPRPATVMCGLCDCDGNAIQIRSADRLEIVSNQFGCAIFELTSDAEPVRKKRRMLGWLANITRVEEHEFELEEAEP